MSLFTTLRYFGEFFGVSVPYAVSYVILSYGVPVVLKILGFSPTGILLHSIASWIQSKYGVSYVFSLLQSIGARGGIANPRLWSFIYGTAYKFSKPWKIWLTGSAPVLVNSKSEQSYSASANSLMVLVLVGIVCIAIFQCFEWYQHDRQHIINNIIGQANRLVDQHSRDTVQEADERLPVAAVTTQTTHRSSPPKVSNILPRNSCGNYICPGCKKQYKPQGITNHVKSCDKEWCKKNGINVNVD
jgi:hypothetical protein